MAETTFSWLLRTFLLFSVLFQCSEGQKDLQITNVTSPTSAQLVVSWNSSSTLVAYFMLDLRVVNNTSIAAITAIASTTSRSKLMQGLRTGTYYNVTLKSYGSSGALLATTWVQAQTVPATPEISTANGISSSEITVGWSSLVGVDFYFLMVSLGKDSINRTYKALNCSIGDLKPSSLYSLTLYGVNSAGSSAASKRITVLTLTPPPTNVSVTTISSYAVTLTWSSVDYALMYGIFVYEVGLSPNLAYIRKTTSLVITLDNLLPCTHYMFALTSYNWFYTAGQENQLLYETGKVASPQILNIQYNNNLGTALISWTSSLGASSYMVTAKSDSNYESLCTSTSNSCEIQSLVCEQRYTVSTVALTNNCTSNTSEALILETAPCAPKNVTIIRDCSINTVNVYWNPVIGAVRYISNAFAPDGSKEECANQDTYCFFMNLLCGTEYEISVLAFNGKINSSGSPRIKIRTAPCEPRNVQAIIQCQDNSLDVSWNPSNGASFYKASVLGSSGVTYNCSSVNTSCQIVGLECGESLSLSVIAYDVDCPSMSSHPEDIVTVPCAPSDVLALTDCDTKSTVIRWSYSEGAVVYVAKAVATDGSEHSCESFELSCTLSELPCSQTYMVSVTANNYECISPQSPSSEFNTVPCIPKNIGANLNCDQNTIHVTWSEDNGNVTFKATAKSDSSIYNCTSQERYCEITNVACGQLYTVSVDAEKGQCLSSSNETASLYSVPCKPTDISTQSVCANDSTVITWTESLGVGTEMYVAAMHTQDEQNLMCQSTTNQCVIGGIKCGKIYNASVTAVSSDCQSPSSELYVDPVPCSPVGVQSQVSANLVVASWMDMTGALNYRSNVTGSNGDRYVCQTSNTSCAFEDLQCGHQYNMVIEGIGQYCNSNVSGTHTFQTAPCVPQNVTAEVDCVTNVAGITWERSLGANNYTALAIGADGEYHVCYSSGTSCDISGLSCGRMYVVTISATNGESTSEPSLGVDLHTAPCIPVLNLPQIICYNNSVSLSWSRTSGAISYISNVTSPGVESLFCQTEDTSCTIDDLKCGRTYIVTVTAINAQCSGPTTLPETLITAPCQPQNVVTKMNCSDSEAILSWEAAPGALSYLSVLRTHTQQYVVCNSTEIGCVVSRLPCGSVYDVIITSVNNQCASKSSFPVELYTVPCVPTAVQSIINCESSVVSVMWAETAGAVNYTVIATGPQGKYYCQTSNTSCSFPQLSCGLELNTTVVAVGNTCVSDVSPSTAFNTVPCKARNPTMTFDCSIAFAVIDWEAALGAVSYTAAITAEDGQRSECSSLGLSCTLYTLKCGQIYNLTVETYGSSCSSIVIASENFHTAPCIPQNVTAYVNCLTNEAALTWSKTPGAFNYTALVIGQDGEYACNTTSTSCDITHLNCGLTYNLTVTGYYGQCQGQSSDPTEFITAPCTPVNVLGEIDCDAASVALSWSAMGGIEGFTSYLVGSDGVTRTCNSTGENCTFSGLPCGYEYDGFVYAVNKQCEGPLSQSVKIYSAPCVPLDVKTSVNRIENSVLISWNLSPGAIIYTSSVISINGDSHNCSTENTSCQVQELTCGKVYTTMVTAYNSMCNSSESTATQFKSVPCSPENLEVNVTSDCVVLSWGEAPGAVNYTAEVIGVDGETYTCNSTNTSCVMANLMCGYQYSVILTANGEELSSKVSYTHQFKTAPCTPQNTLIYVDCVANSATVSWNSSLGAENYTSKAVGTNGEYHICNSTATSCDFTNLTCGISYEVTVQAINEASSSNLSLPVDFITAPCIPVLKPLQINCYDNSVSLSWEKTLGAINYTSSITSPAVDTLSCTTEDTGCTISDLKCGWLYSVTVTAINSQCLSPISAQSMLTTVPCQPQNMMAKMNCYNSSTLLSWNEAPGALRYMSILTGFGEEPLVCNSTEPACEIPGLHCGQSYNVTVTAFNNDCQSIPSSETELYTVPCVPTELQAQVECESNVATLSWISSMGADKYTAKIIGANGEEHGCSTVDSSCSFTQLSCGLVYEATVVAVGKMCSSDISPVNTFHTVPCVATDIESQYQCGSEDAIISWGAVSGGIRYTAIATTQDGESTNCSNTDTSCTVSSLQCGQIYTVTVESFGVICNSRAVSPKVIQTEPCVPQNLSAYIDCQLNNAIFNWSSALGSENYTALVVTTDAEVHTCHTTSMSCAITNLPCGHTYNVTITAFNNQCQGQSSNDIQVITAPCAPEQVHAEIDCATNSLEISWNQMSEVETFISYLTASDVGNWTCNSILENCSFPNLPCGHEFSVTVAAANRECRGPLSNAVKILTAPCIPTNINTAVDCVSGSALVSWSQSLGALNYTSILIGPQEEKYNCSSQETSCWVPDIVCGEKYTVAVQAQNEVCSSMVHNITDLQACSCVPQNISIFNPCTSDAVRLHWTEPIGAVLYKSFVTSSLGEIHTCETTNNTCDIRELQCGETYSATVTVFNIQQANVSLDVQTFLTAPCIASNIRAQFQCGTNMASLLWDPSQGASSYVALVTGINGWNSVCSSNSTTCDIYDLECGQMYSVSLIASNSDCNSMSNATDIYSAPCIPQNVRTEVICGTNITDVSWDRTPGARNYTATVRDYGGNTYLCSTEETTCRIESLECGENYHVIVTAHGEQCDSKSDIVEFRTGPCILYVLEVLPSCTLDFLTLSWVTTLGADYYVGTLTDQNGETLTCRTSDQTCDIKGLQCGDTYNVTLTAYNEQCNSGKSLPTLLSTAPCVPTNLSSSVDCDTQSVTVSWEVAPGAAVYSLTAISGLHETSFITTNTSYEFTDLLCDRVYEITASSTSDSCNSQGNSSLHVKTIPCPPHILSAYASCENISGIIHWDSSQNAKSYVAVLEGSNRLSCNTSDTTCEIPELECGQNYTATVWAEDGTCNGTVSPKMTFITVPCIPQNVNSTLLCQKNSLSVSWDASSGATAYVATAVGRQGQTITVDVQDPTCLLSGLQCGEVYSLTVLALNDECKSAESTGLEITSVPCSPMHVIAIMDCNVNGATAIWEPSTGAMAYMVLFSGSDGHEVSCTSTNMSCSVSGLHCGENYSVTVTAFDNSCHGISSNTTIISAVPCNPTNAEATVDCSSADLINVTWAPSKGAMSYIVTAKGDDGHTLSCGTTTSTCFIKDVHCGDIYSISVTAWSIDCSSDTVFVGVIETVPCTPDIVEVQIDCLTNEALVSWKENNTHPTYNTAVATDPLGKELSCSQFNNSCSISGLECGLKYSFQVHSSNHDCSSLNSSAYISNTAPCQPIDVITNVHCENNAGIISWAESRGAIHYMATLTGNGSTLNCNTTDTTCSFNGLQCSQSYSVNVMAMDDKCVSVLSAISTFPTAPCQPQGFSIDLDCSNQSVSMLWEESNGAQLYHVDIESSIGELNSYTTTSLFFSSEVLSCSKTYWFTVMAIGETCNSSKSVTLYENSAPCVPVDVQYTTKCPTTMALVTWSASEGAIDYHVSASAPGGLESHCNSSSTSCSLSGLDCGLSYNVQVVAVGQKCSSNGSSLVLLDTAPCLPKNLDVHMDCTNNSAILSWEESRGAQHYVGEVVSDQDSVFCNTEGTNCIVPDLSCGTLYSFSVLAMDMQCNSSFTEPVLSGMVPCPPEEVETSIYRGDVKPQEVEISWNGSHCGTDYMATVQGQIGYDPESSFILNSYWTSYMDFYIPVPCSSFYNVTVTARNPAGSSSPSTPITGYTAPCPPQVNPLVESAGTIFISWEGSPYANEYRVVEMDNGNTICTTPGLACQTSFTSSNFQVISVNPSGESDPAFVPGYTAIIIHNEDVLYIY